MATSEMNARKALATLQPARQQATHKLIETLEELSTCGICAHTYSSTVTRLHAHSLTQCGHVVCAGCLTALLQNRSAGCPVCRAAFPAAHSTPASFPRNFVAEHVNEAVAKHSATAVLSATTGSAAVEGVARRSRRRVLLEAAELV